MPSWTKEQSQAINDRGHNIIVSAGAGSGKTAVLSERVITNLKRGMHINEMLLLTFTKAASGEMRERIRKKIKKEESLKEELDLIDTAYITTFDSFALSIVKKYHYLLNLSKDIKIIDNETITLKKIELLNNIIDSYYEKEDKDFIDLINTFCIKDDEEIRKSILDISNKLDMLSNKEKYLDLYIDKYYNELFIDENVTKYINLIKEKVLEIKNELNNLSYYVDNKYYDKINESLYNLLNTNTYEEIKQNLNIKLPILKTDYNEAKIIKENISNLIKEIKSLTTYENETELKQSIIKTKPYVQAIINIIKDFTKEVKKYKKEYNIYEFTDISIMAINIVKNNEEIKEELKNHFKEIMIDEYQDTSDLQEEFISLIENNNVYMVGDIKQSIYRFRNANPIIFKTKYDKYTKHIDGEKIDLNKNFRSRQEVLENINLIFNMIMDDEIGGADYIKQHQMIFGNNTYNNEGKTEQNNNFEIYKYSSDTIPLFDKNEIEAFIIANDIKKKIESNYKIFDKDELVIRNITYNDFVILMDRTTDFNLYKKIFEYLNIPLTLYKDETMNNDIDILTIKNVINLIIKIKKKEYDKKFKYLYISVLRSFLFNIDDDLIFDIVTNNKFYNDELFKKCKKISKNLDNISIKELLEEIIKEFDYYNKIITIGNIQNSIIKLDKLLEMSDNLSNLNYTIENFGNYLQEIIDNEMDIKYNLNNNKGNSVKIMTIHKSKGLEYHICYYSGLYKTFNISDLKQRFMYDKTYGIITPYFDEGISEIIYKPLIKANYIKEEVSEKIRLFYVALTRAKEKMILLLPSKDNNIGAKINNVVENNIRIKYKSFQDIMYSVEGALTGYIKLEDINKLNITKDYNLIKETNYKKNIETNNEIIEVKELNINNNIIEKQTFSKKLNTLIDKKTAKNIELGLKLHEILEYTDLKQVDINNKETNEIIKNLLNQDIMKNIKEANIYHEYEFIEQNNNNKSHGIIDLMCEYKDYIDIIDYKLQNIEDDNYIKQLKGYKDYIERVTNKKTNIYLYSILNNKIKIIQ